MTMYTLLFVSVRKFNQNYRENSYKLDLSNPQLSRKSDIHKWPVIKVVVVCKVIEVNNISNDAID